MLITKKELSLLQNATAYLPKYFRNFLIEHITEMVEQSNDFRQKIFRVLREGLIFKISQKNDKTPFGRYSITKNIMFFCSPHFISDLPLIEAKGSLSIILRHEITHANDFLYKRNNSYLYATTLELMSTVPVGNSLLNAVACINRNKLVNLALLDKLTRHLIDYETIGQIHFLGFHGKRYDLIEVLISALDTFGSYPIDPLSNTLKIYKYRGYNGNFITLKSSNLVLIRELFLDSNVIRQLNPFNLTIDSGLKVFDASFDPNKYQFWNTLPEEKYRKTLDTIYTIYERIILSVSKDDSCFPIFEKCVQDNKNNCLNSSIACQLSLPDKDIALKSMAEIHAALEERTKWRSFDLDTLGELCQPIEKLTNETSLLPYTFLYSAGFSFVNDLTQLYVTKREYQYKECILLVVNIGYILSVNCFQFYNSSDEKSSILTQIALPVALTFIKKAVEISSRYLGSDKISTCVKHVSTAIVTGMSLYQGTKTTVTSLLGSITGSIFAKSTISLFSRTQLKKIAATTHPELPSTPAILTTKSPPKEPRFLNTTFGENSRKGLAIQKTRKMLNTSDNATRIINN